MSSVHILMDSTRRRSLITCEAMRTGIDKVGDKVVFKHESQYRSPEGDALLIYGMNGNCRRAFEEYRKAGKPAVYIDLGYWGRRQNGTSIGRWKGYHKISVGDRHPTAYFMRFEHGPERAERLGLDLSPWRKGGRHILVAGMGAKASRFEGFEPEEWERGAIAALRRLTDRPIVYRPKPNCPVSRPIDGTLFSPGTQPLAEPLADCHALVTHHSNAGVEALVAGVPVFTVAGIAAPLALSDLSRIEMPMELDDALRRRWLNAATFCQFSVTEMTEGVAWRHLKDEGLVP
jgi:hypothetical protein